MLTFCLKELIMTIPFERKRAVVKTEQFLLDLINPQKTPRVPRQIRQQALYLLRHYPSKYDMDRVAETEDQIEASDVPQFHHVFSNKF